MDKTFKHFIITRFNIPAKYAGRKNQNISMVDPKTDEKYLDNRIRLFEKYTFPSIKNQTNKNFKWLVLFSDQTPEKYKNHMNKLQMECEMFCPLYLQDEEAYDFDNYLKSVLENFKCDVYITTRIDNDDAISVKMVERIQNFYEKNKNDNVLLSFSYGLQYTEKNKKLAFQNIFGNHFITMILPGADKTVISFPHNDIPEKIKKVNIGEKTKPMWIEVIHETNYANQTFFNIKNAVKNTDVFKEFKCEVSWKRKDVLKNIIVSIFGTFVCVYQVLKRRETKNG